MARNTRRRASRTAKDNKEVDNEDAKSSSDLSALEEDEPKAKVEETCPACTPETRSLTSGDKESWIGCESCKTWYHWRCVGKGGDVDTIDKWFCEACLSADPKRSITLKPPARKSSRKKATQNYANLENGSGKDAKYWSNIMESKDIRDDSFRRMKGSDVGIEWLNSDENAMTEPIVISSPEGLGMKMPYEGKADFNVNDVERLVGSDVPVEVIDVGSQSASHGWNLRKWAEYINTEPSAREKIYNVISLEVSGTPLADQITPPRLVREVDWVENAWPSAKRGKGHAYPKVQLYCLMGVKDAWTDWHIDFAGSSVYYHILYGTKIFYFIRPTPVNLAAYERWSGTEMQNTTWLGDMVDQVVKVTLTKGYTMIIPTGWIHCVATPEDTLVIGGNFLHSYNVPTQLKIRDIEIRTQVPKKFRFPFFCKLCWYVGEKYLRDIKSSNADLSPRVLHSISCLADFLVSQARLIENGKGGNEHAKREAREMVPIDKIKDAPALARELRWRIRLMLGDGSDEENAFSPKKVNGFASSNKRKRMKEEVPDDNMGDGVHSGVRFRNYVPKIWDDSVFDHSDPVKQTKKTKRPDTAGIEWRAKWLNWKPGEEMDLDEDEASGDASVESRSDVLVKLRKTEHGIERHRIERVLEIWSWEA